MLALGLKSCLGKGEGLAVAIGVFDLCLELLGVFLKLVEIAAEFSLKRVDAT